ncbi:MAG: aminodeoxychorismate/anthranilate synthase component II [Pirellulaceae bacterium]|nr:aminodeoxychorismate/anthranilate synthase component II [Pirellulaceae bacterium]
MILIIDNFDSFTYNLVQRFGEIDGGLDIRVFRNNEIDCDEIARLNPSHLVISPGPCTPHQAGISIEAIRRFHGKLPILGVCLGHQAIGAATGGKIVRANRLMHGKTDLIHHRDKGLFAGLPNPLVATRYHSLVIRPDTLTSEFEMDAWSVDPDGHQEIMGVAHRKYPTFGLQFHPESFLTTNGIRLLDNFLHVQVADDGGVPVG